MKYHCRPPKCLGRATRMIHSSKSPNWSLKPSLLRAAHVGRDEAGRNFFVPVRRVPTDSYWARSCARPNKSIAREPVQIQLQSVLQACSCARSWHLGYPLERQLAPGGEEQTAKRNKTTNYNLSQELGTDWKRSRMAFSCGRRSARQEMASDTSSLIPRFRTYWSPGEFVAKCHFRNSCTAANGVTR